MEIQLNARISKALAQRLDDLLAAQVPPLSRSAWIGAIVSRMVDLCETDPEAWRRIVVERQNGAAVVGVRNESEAAK